MIKYRSWEHAILKGYGKSLTVLCSAQHEVPEHEVPEQLLIGHHGNVLIVVLERR